MQHSKKCSEPPGSFGLLGLGAEEGISFVRNPIDFAETRKAKYKDTKIFKTKLLRKPCAFLLGYKELESMLNDENNHFSRGESLFSLIESIYGKGVMLLDGSDGERVRQLLYQQMETKILSKNYLFMMNDLYSSCLNLWNLTFSNSTLTHAINFTPGLSNYFKHLQADYKVNNLNSISLYEFLKQFCNISNLKMWFGTDGMTDELLIKLINALKDHYRGALSIPVLAIGGDYKKGMLAKDFLISFIRKKIKQCRTNHVDDLKEKSEDVIDSNIPLQNSLIYKIVFSTLENKEDNTWKNDEELETQILWMTSNVIPKTVASLATSIFMVLDKQNDIKESLLEELLPLKDNIVDIFSNCDNNILESKTPILDSIIEETLRLYPPFVTFCKSTNTNLTNFHGYSIPKDWQCFYLSSFANKDENVYDDPNTFNYKRWLDIDNCKMHLSFGKGSRICLGKDWSKLITKIMVSRLLCEYEFDIIKDQDLTFKCLPVLRPKSGLRITNFRLRE